MGAYAGAARRRVHLATVLRLVIAQAVARPAMPSGGRGENSWTEIEVSCFSRKKRPSLFKLFLLKQVRWRNRNDFWFVCFLGDCNAAMTSVAELVAVACGNEGDDEEAGQNIVESASGHIMIKRLIANDKQRMENSQTGQ